MRNQQDHQSKLQMDWLAPYVNIVGKPHLSNLGSSTLLAPPKGKVDERIMLLPSIYIDHVVVVYKLLRVYLYMFFIHVCKYSGICWMMLDVPLPTYSCGVFMGYNPKNP